MKPQDLRNADTAGSAVAAGMRQDWKQDFAHVPELVLPNWQLAAPAASALQHLGSYIDGVAAAALERAANTLSSVADAYEHVDTTAAASLGAPGAPGGQG
ncbi:hypothetical protein ACIRVF_42610 [Kitasatospora sp. NPDC101157]|uniref:hypothetical protein n=1 Tax=Kitasatospora sp. NPDC101157 TaxID=3364098 RepID=UPI003809A2C0